MMLASRDTVRGRCVRAQRRVALVIGNAAYQGAAALRTTRNDAKDMAEALKRLGFEIVLGVDLDQDHFASTMETFARALDGADIGLFFYAGHGLQIDERNYLVSINAQLEQRIPDFVRNHRARCDRAPDGIQGRHQHPAARRVPRQSADREPQAQPRRAAASTTLGKGLARIETANRDTMVAYAAAPGEEAADGDEGNSPFTAALLKRIAEPGLEISVMLKQVTADVRAATRDKQRPQQLGDMSRRVYFAPADAGAAAPEQSAPRRRHPKCRAPRTVRSRSHSGPPPAPPMNATRSGRICSAIPTVSSSNSRGSRRSGCASRTVP